MKTKSETWEVIIIGSGPAGLTAAIYLGRAGLRPLVFAGMEFGGQLMTTNDVENYPGFPEGIQGPELMQNMLKQAERFGAEILYKNVTKVDFASKVKTVWADKKEYKSLSVLIATGASPRKIGLESEVKYWGRGVSSCATCDGALFKNKIVAVIGGGDSAMEEAGFLTRFAGKVFLIHRRDSFRASKIMQDRIEANKKVEVIWNTEVTEVLGDGFVVNGLKLHNNKTNSDSELKVDGMFLAIGHIPNTNFLDKQLKLDSQSYIEVENRTYTSAEGVFVAGDVHDSHYRQAVTAAGLGCMAALDMQKWLEDKGVKVDTGTSSYT